MTAADLAELARLEAAAEPAPWEINCSLIQFDDADRSLVVAARNALPALLQKIQSQEAELDAQEVDLDAKHAKLVAALARESRLREALAGLESAALHYADLRPREEVAARFKSKIAEIKEAALDYRSAVLDLLRSEQPPFCEETSVVSRAEARLLQATEGESWT